MLKFKTIKVYRWPMFWLLCVIMQGLCVITHGTISVSGIILNAFVYFFAMPAMGYFLYRLSPIKIGYFFSVWLWQTPAIIYVNGQTSSEQLYVLVMLVIVHFLAMFIAASIKDLVM